MGKVYGFIDVTEALNPHLMVPVTAGVGFHMFSALKKLEGPGVAIMVESTTLIQPDGYAYFVAPVVTR